MRKGVLPFWAVWVFFVCLSPVVVFGSEKIADVVGEFAKERPLLPEPPHDQIWSEPVTGMQFVWVKEGCYQMGCGAWSGDCESDEKPAHEVCVDGFWMGKTEVTQAQWRKIMGENPSRHLREGEYPVEQVAFDDVLAFIRKLNIENLSQNVFRLPTEAEWEYAARSGGQDELYAGGTGLDDLGWHRINAGEEPRQVGARKPNGLGLYDMSGNLYEWCSDWYGEGYYGVSPKNNPLGPSAGDKKVIRGGAVTSDAESLRTTNRGRNSVSCPNHMVGVRLVWAPAGKVQVSQ